MQPIAIEIIALTVWIADVVITFGIFGLLIAIYIKAETRNKVQLGVCLLYLCLGLGRCVFIVFDYFLTQHNLSLYQTYQNVWKLATAFVMIGLGFLIIVSEYRIFKKKDYFVFFWGFIIVFIIGLLSPNFVWTENLINISFLFALFIPIGYIYLSFKMVGEIRKGIIIALIGMLVYIFSLVINKIEIMEGLAVTIGSVVAIPYIINYLYMLAAIIQIVGVLLTYFGFKKMYFETDE